MFFRLSKADDVEIFVPFCVCHAHNKPLQPTNGIEALLTIDFSGILCDAHWRIKYRFATDKIKSMLANVQVALWFIPSWHACIVATKSSMEID